MKPQCDMKIQNIALWMGALLVGASLFCTGQSEAAVLPVEQGMASVSLVTLSDDDSGLSDADAKKAAREEKKRMREEARAKRKEEREARRAAHRSSQAERSTPPD